MLESFLNPIIISDSPKIILVSLFQTIDFSAQIGFQMIVDVSKLEMNTRIIDFFGSFKFPAKIISKRRWLKVHLWSTVNEIIDISSDFKEMTN